MGSAKETERKTAPDTEVDKTIDKGVEVSDANEESGSDDEESDYVVVRARPSSPTSSLVSFQAWRDGVDTWIAKSDAWRDQTDDKLKALTDVLLETRELVRSLSRGAFFAELDGGDQARAAREVGRASESLDTGNPEEREDLLAPEVPAPPEIKEDVNPNIKEESLKTGIGSDITPPTAQAMAGASSAQGPVKEDEIRAVLLQRSLTTSELVDTFKARLKSLENKKAFAEILKRISKIQKIDNQNYVVLRK